jgi:hypothetical protein
MPPGGGGGGRFAIAISIPHKIKGGKNLEFQREREHRYTLSNKKRFLSVLVK